MAVKCLRDSLLGRQENLDEMGPKIAENLARLEHIYLKRSEFNLAVNVFSDCLKIREATHGTDIPSKIAAADAYPANIQTRRHTESYPLSQLCRTKSPGRQSTLIVAVHGQSAM